MAYKFQLGAARLSGSTTFEEALVVESTISASSTLHAASLTLAGAASGVSTLGASGLASLDGGINVNDDFTVNTDGAVTAVGVNAGGALSGVTTLAASGLASVASISMDDGSTLGPDSVAGLWTFSADGDTTQANGAYDFDLASHDGTNGLKLGGVLVDASAADLNFTNVAAAGTAEASKALVLSAAKAITGITNVTASYFSGNGAALTNISSDSVDVADSSANSEFRLIGVAASGDGVSLTTMDTAADRITMNAETGKLTVTGDVAANDIAAAGLTLSDLTSGRLVLAGTSGILEDNTFLDYSGGALRVYSKNGMSSAIMTKTASIAVLNAAANAVLGQINNGGAFDGQGGTFADSVTVSGSSDTGLQVTSIFDGGMSIGAVGHINVGAGGGDFDIILNSNGNISGSGNLNIGGSGDFDGGLFPLTDGTRDLGSSTKEWKDLYIDGVAYIDDLRADALGAAMNCASQAMTNINVDSGAIDGTIIGASSQAAGEFTTVSGSSWFRLGGTANIAGNVIAEGNLNTTAGNISGSGALMIGGQSTFNGHLLPLTDGLRDLGSSTKEFRDLYIDNVAYIDSLQADSLGAALDANSQSITNINVDSGAIDGTVIGANSQAAAEFTTLSGSSTLHVGGNVTMAGLGTSDVALGDDMMIINDGASGAIKNTSLAAYSTAIAGAGLLSTAGVVAIVNSANGGIQVGADSINIDFNDLSAAAVNVAADSIAFLDADGNVTQKESIADFVGFIAGTGLSAASGQLSVSAVSTPTAFGDAAAVMVEGLNYASATLTAARVLTLPDSDDLDVGESVKIKMAAGLSSTIYASVVIDVGSGDLIDGDASIRLESPYAAVNLYKVAANTWRIL
jgi:hypothetical protein